MPASYQPNVVRHLLIAAALLLTVVSTARAQVNPEKLAARDKHEGLLVAADPYVDAARAKDRFGKASPLEAGILPVELFIRNDTQQPIRVGLSTIRLVLEPRGEVHQRLEALDVSSVVVLIAHPGGTPNPESPRSRFPRRVPRPSNDKKEKALAAILRPLALDADVVPPSSIIHGFLFFDLNHDFDQLESASLYLPDFYQIPSKQPLTYFEVEFRASARH